MRKYTWVVLGLAAALAAGGFLGHGARSLAQPQKEDPAGNGVLRIGDTATVYLRGDASGIAYGDRVVGLGNLIQHQGTVDRIDQRWLVLKAGDRRYHVPWASILTVESRAAAPEKKAGAVQDAGAPKPAVQLEVEIEE